jgi:hypothetical protein
MRELVTRIFITEFRIMKIQRELKHPLIRSLLNKLVHKFTNSHFEKCALEENLTA